MSSYQHIRDAGQAYEFIRYEVMDRIARVTLNATLEQQSTV